jgi:hypothetical protein
MSLSVFIHDHHDEIIQEFAAFAKTLMPPGVPMNEAAIRDHAEDLLTAIGKDMGAAQTAAEQSRKSRGLGTAHTMAASARSHADVRIEH